MLTRPGRGRAALRLAASDLALRAPNYPTPPPSLPGSSSRVNIIFSPLLLFFSISLSYSGRRFIAVSRRAADKPPVFFFELSPYVSAIIATESATAAKALTPRG